MRDSVPFGLAVASRGSSLPLGEGLTLRVPAGSCFATRRDGVVSEPLRAGRPEAPRGVTGISTSESSPESFSLFRAAAAYKR